MKSLFESLSVKHQKILCDNYHNFDLTAMDFFDKYHHELSEVETMELFARIKTWQTQNKIQNMLWNESERLGDVYYLRKAGNWVGCDFYQAIVKEEEKEYINKHKENWEEKE